MFEIHFTDGSIVLLDDADAYQPEGAFMTFFRAGSSRQTLDAWSHRIASYRSTELASVRRLGAAPEPTVDLREPSIPIVLAGGLEFA